MPDFSTSRAVREDLFRAAASDNASFFFNTDQDLRRYRTESRFALERWAANTFRGPAFHQFDFALIKDTAFRAPAEKNELGILELRAEFFNLFNIVNFGLPSNTVRGFGIRN